MHPVRPRKPYPITPSRRRPRPWNAAALLATLTCLGTLAACSDPATNNSAGLAFPDGNSSDGNIFNGGNTGNNTDAVALTDTNADGGPDANGACSGEAYCTCGSNGDCDSGICIDSPKGKVCAAFCVSECPQGWACSTLQSPGGDVVSVCVPKWGKLCNPCADVKDCQAPGVSGALCVDLGDAGGFCGSPCSGDSDCPTSHQCKDTPGKGGGQAKLCVPRPVAGNDDAAAGCTCSDVAISAGLSTVCQVNVIGAGGVIKGTCSGERRCLASGLGACEVPKDTVEVCDGLDNDCDGQTDLIACDDSNACTLDICKPGSGTDGCSHTPSSGACNADDDACTEGDSCATGSCVPGAKKACDDGNPCTLDGCDAKTGCTQTPDDGKPCDDENPCTVGDVCASGQCSGGVAKACTSGDACVDAKCKITTGKCEFSDKIEGAPCDDGSLCTTGETCQSGDCKGKPAPCDDQNACTVDSCAPGVGCNVVAGNEGGSCDDGNQCTKGGGCKAGVCVGGTPVTCNDNDPCTDDFCDAKTNTCKANPKAGCGTYCSKPSDCADDGDVCTSAVCNLVDSAIVGTCGTAPVSGACDDGNPCTASDTCVNGACKGLGKDCDDANPCTSDGCDPVSKACTHSANNAPCDDSNACTNGDICANSGCKPGVAVCTIGQGCNGAGDCAAGACVNGVCTAIATCRPIGKASTGALGAISLSGSAVIDTTAGTIYADGKSIVLPGAAGVELLSQAGTAPKLRIFHVESFTVALNASVKVQGTYGLVIAAKSGINISGTLDAKGTVGGAGSENVGASGGAGGPGGATGGSWISGQGCSFGNGDGKGPGGSQRGTCGGSGGKGGAGVGGAGGGGGGGGCGGTGGPGASFADLGEDGYGGAAATDGSKGLGVSGVGSAGAGCLQGAGNAGAGQPYGDDAMTVFWGGSGGGGGGFGGFHGFGGEAKGSDGTAYGGLTGFSGGSGGGGGGGGLVALCGGSEIFVSGTVDASGGGGGSGGTSGFPEAGKSAEFSAKQACGGGGGAGRSGGGAGGGGGSGGAIYLSASKIVAGSGKILAGGGIGAGGGFAFSGGQGGPGKNGGSFGGKGGDGGKGGAGGKGALGRVRVEAGSATLGSVTGKISQGGL